MFLDLDREGGEGDASLRKFFKKWDGINRKEREGEREKDFQKEEKKIHA